MQEKGSRAVPGMTRQQFNIICESSGVVPGASKRRWAPLTTRGTRAVVQTFQPREPLFLKILACGPLVCVMPLVKVMVVVVCASEG